MIEGFRRWLRGSTNQPSEVSVSPTTARGGTTDVPPDAIQLAHRLLGVCLTTLGAGDRISDISDMSIAPYRHLIELLPLRVYVYTLGSPMAQMDYRSILNSNRPAGAVFDAFEMSFSDVRCGFYVYSLQTVSDEATLRALWRDLREEVGRPVVTAALPDLHRRHQGGGADNARSAAGPDVGSSVRMLPLDSDPEELVRMLVGQPPPSQRLATYDLATPEDIMRPIFAFALRENEYPFERQDFIDFVRRNENLLGRGIDFLIGLKGDLQGFSEHRQQVDRIRSLIDIFSRQARLVFEGRESEVDVRSEVIYWLITILANQANEGVLSFEAASKYLERDQYRVRLGPATLRPMLLEFARKLGTAERQEPAKLHLLLEAANLCRESAVLIAGREILAESGGDRAVASRLESTSRSLSEADLDSAGLEFLREVRARTYLEIDDADL